MDFRTFEENADAAAERRERVKQQQAEVRERMAQKRKASMEKLKDKKAGSKPNRPTSSSYAPPIGAHRSATGKTEIGGTFYSKDADD